MSDHQTHDAAMKNVPVHATSHDATQLSPQTRPVVIETPLTIEIKDVGVYTLMCTPTDVVPLAAGFLFTEGLIHRSADIGALARCEDDPHMIRIHLTDRHDPQDVRRQQGMILSSCGLCGSESIRQFIASLPICGDTVRIEPAKLSSLLEQLRAQQDIFAQTGATHAAAVFREGKLLALGEDVGRHNALDKALGKCLLSGMATAGAIVALSGRVSLELAVKAARAGIELIAAVSAPTTLAIDVAQRCHITLCGFVRGPEATIYCHEQRLVR